MPDLELSAAERGQVMIVTVTGEVDLDNAGQLERELGNAFAESDRIVVDITDVPLCDSTGLNVLLKAQQQAEQRGGNLVLVGPQPAVRKVLSITGLDAILLSHATTEEGVQAVSA